MTIRFSKGGKWYALGDKLPGGLNPLILAHRKSGSYFTYTGPYYNTSTGAITNNGDSVLMGMYLGGVLHPFLTHDSSRMRGALPPPVHISYNATPSYANPRAYAIITENIVFKKVDDYSWTSEKTLNYLEKTILAGNSSDFVGNLVANKRLDDNNEPMWTVMGFPFNGLFIMSNNELQWPLTREPDLADYLIKVLA